MPIHLRQDVATLALAQVEGGLDGLVGAWQALAEDNEDVVRPRQKSTIYRWLKKGVPGGGEEVLAICGLLDVDPLALFDYQRNGYFDRFATLRRNIQLGLSKIGVLAPLYALYQPGPFWPSDGLAERYWSRPWCRQEFTNQADWTSSDYVLVTARFHQPPQGQPRAVHIAYRRLGSRDTMWRFYGSVIALEGELHLYSESGDHQIMGQVNKDEIRFRTYFGGRPVEFRLASLHAAEIELEFPYNDPETIGFEW